MVFGAFDGAYDAHHAFFVLGQESRRLFNRGFCSRCRCRKLERQKSFWYISARLEELKKEDGVGQVIIGDAEIGV